MESEREKGSVEVEAGKNVVKLKGARGCEVLSAGRMEVFCGKESDGENRAFGNLYMFCSKSKGRHAL